MMSANAPFLFAMLKDISVPTRLRLAFLMLPVLALLGGVRAVSAAELQPVEIITASGVQVFSVELARTDEERATGLMYRKELADGRGMLFDFGNEQNVAMWMKNTFVSLDMIFIRGDGRILRIAENTEPQSTKIIASGGPVKGVLEVVAGTARKYGIAPGDRVAHAMFGAR
jgi:uncharacterized membrane protein (UPF0127 family)